MTPKRTVIRINTANAKRKRAERAAKPPEQREIGLESNVLRDHHSRAAEKPENKILSQKRQMRGPTRGGSQKWDLNSGLEFEIRFRWTNC